MAGSDGCFEKLKLYLNNEISGCNINYQFTLTNYQTDAKMFKEKLKDTLLCYLNEVELIQTTDSTTNPPTTNFYHISDEKDNVSLMINFIAIYLDIQENLMNTNTGISSQTNKI